MATKILVINNSDDVLSLFNKVLKSEDRTVYLQVYLNSDLHNVQKIQPDLIILDYYVGREGVGWEFLQLLKMDDTTAPIPVLICTTAVKLAFDIAGYLATKGVTVLRKPFESHDLLRAVTETVRTTGSKSSLLKPFSTDGH
jgi:CheY-like chemotaxis protein